MRSFNVFLILLVLVILNLSVYAEEMSVEAKAFRGQLISMSKEGRHEEILSSLRELYSMDTSDSEIARAYLNALVSVGKADEALENIDEIMADRLNSSEYYITKFKIYEAQNKFLKAARLYRYMYEKGINTEDYVLWEIGLKYSWAGENLEAIKYFDLYEAKTNLNDEQKLVFADVLFWAGKNSKALRKYDQLSDKVFKDEKKSLQYCQAYCNVDETEAVNVCMQASKAWPQNLEIKAQYAYILYNSGDIDRAEEIFDELSKLNPADLKLQEDAIRVLASVGRYKRAKAIAERVLEFDPKYQPIRLWYARILSWDREYEFSVDQYDILISQDTENQMYWREKARVLSWMRAYHNSQKVYDAAEEKFQSKAITLEAKVHYDKNRSWFRWAKTNLEALSKLEPENDNAMIEKGLLYSELGLWGEAANIYKRLLRKYPLMALIIQANEKNNIYSDEIQFTHGFSLYEADSESRFVDVFYWNVYSKARAPINNKLYIYHEMNNRYYRFPSLISRLNRYRNDIGLQYYLRPTLWMDFSYAYADKSDNVESSHFAKFDLFVEYIEPLLINLRYQRDDVEENATTLYRHLQKDDYMFRVRYDVHKRLYIGSDYTYSNYTDGNERNKFGSDISYNITCEPKRFTVQYRIEKYGFDESRDWYFAPSSFRTHGPGLEWRHYLNGDEMHWGSNDTYYTLRYGLNIDSSHQRGHKLHFDFHKDWTDRLSTHAEYDHIIYEHEDTYIQRGIKFYIRWYW